MRSVNEFRGNGAEHNYCSIATVEPLLVFCLEEVSARTLTSLADGY